MSREAVTLGPCGDSSVLRTPSTAWSPPLRGAPVEDSESSARHGEIELVGSKITSGVGCLHDHLLPLHGAARERQLVASTTPAGFGAASDGSGSESVRQSLGDCPGRLVGAHIRRTTITS